MILFPIFAFCLFHYVVIYVTYEIFKKEDPLDTSDSKNFIIMYTYTICLIPVILFWFFVLCVLFDSLICYLK